MAEKGEKKESEELLKCLASLSAQFTDRAAGVRRDSLCLLGLSPISSITQLLKHELCFSYGFRTSSPFPNVPMVLKLT